MSSYILPILIFALTLGCWAMFQLWTGHQPDGRSIDQDDSTCADCQESCTTDEVQD
jgi:hypothetical protein